MFALKNRVCVAAVCLAILPACTALSQETPAAADAPRVKAVVIEGVSGKERSAVERAIRVRAGDAYSENAVQSDYIAILELSFVRSATSAMLDTAEGIVLTYRIIPRSVVKGIIFIGNRKLKRKKLLKVGGLTDFKYHDMAVLNDAANLIVAEYKKKGYLFAKADFATRPDGFVVFNITEGRRTKVRAVKIMGNTAFSDALLKKQVKTKTRKYLVVPYRLDEAIVDDDSFRIRDFYHSRGYLDASVKIALDINKKGITVTFQVTEGLLYTVRSIAVEGNTVISETMLLSSLDLVKGAYYSPDRLAGDIRKIADAYGLIGYAEARVVPVTMLAADAPEVSVSLRITEGIPLYINEIEIIGNDKTRDTVIRRELTIAPGEKLNTAEVDKSRRNIERRSLFEKVEVLPYEKTDDRSKRNVIIRVTEQSTGRLMLGAGIDSNNGFTGQIAFSQRNFDWKRPPHSCRDLVEGRAWVGGGQSLELEARPGSEYSSFSILFRNPRVYDSRYSLSLGATRAQRDREYHTEKIRNGRVGVGRTFAENAFWEAFGEIGTKKITDIEKEKPGGPIPTYLTGLVGSNRVNLLGFTLGHDNTNSAVMPSDGHRISATIEASAKDIDSEFDFLRVIMEGRWYQTLKTDELDRAYILSWRGKTGLLLPKCGSTDSPIFERFFVGGGGDVRGFEYRGLGPHGDASGFYDDEAVGGEFMAVGGLQYEVPLHGEHLRAVLFYDLGTLVDDPGDFALEEIRHSVGFGIRFFVPPPLNLPIALDFGFPLAEEDEDETQLISFSFGRFI